MNLDQNKIFTFRKNSGYHCWKNSKNLSLHQELLSKKHFNDYVVLLQMTSFEIEHYEKLHEDYKKLMSEYQELSEKGESGNMMESKLEELKNKQEEIAKEFSKIDKK